MQYLNEHLFPGQLGHLLMVLSFVAALLSTIAYFLATQKRDTPEYEGWRNLGRYGYLVHGVTTLSVIGVLFYILTQKMYEYHYAWANVSDDLPFRYVFSAFWKEQQGSFLLWSFWNVVLGLVLILRGGRWETSVLAVIALSEAFIASMMQGLYFGEFRFGASPFDLLRDAMDAPIFAQADYLSKVKGQGLNPLLQNYWMTIHPPTLFLGFASTVVPFAFAISGLWLREHREWLRPALKWSLFSAAILGTGILMGGAWAYEALSFAGYWAWDPVENTSLVPWLTLVAGIHTNLVARSTGHSIKSTYAFYLMTFLLILYSTYLTRSGILGDTSVHAFTSMGLGFQLVLFMVVFTLLGLVLYFWRRRGVPTIAQEEGLNTREFWMFLGSLVLLFSAVLITGATSLPVWNKLVEFTHLDKGIKSLIPDPEASNAFVKAIYTTCSGKLAIEKPVAHHNRYQIWIAVFLGLLSGLAQWLRYNERNWAGWVKKFSIHTSIALLAAAVLTWLNGLWIHIEQWPQYVFLFAGMFTVVANADYLFSVGRGNLKLAASAVSHFGLGALLLGILSTGLGKEWVSSNAFAMEGLIQGMDDEQLQRNVMLLKEAPIPIKNGFEATYLRDTLERQTRTFDVQFSRRDANGNPTGEQFTLRPNVMYDRAFEKVVANNPSTQHYWNYDLFTLVSSLPAAELDPEIAKQQEDSLKYNLYEAVVGDTFFTKEHYFVVEGLTKQPKHPEYKGKPGDLAFGLQMRAYSLDEPKGYPLEPMMYLRPGEGGYSLASAAGPLGLKVKLNEASMERVFRTEEALKYKQFQVRKGESFDFQGFKVQLTDIERDATAPSYVPETGDIAVAARLDISGPGGQKATAAPLFVIRGAQPLSFKDDVSSLGLHFRFEKVDPSTGQMTIGAAYASGEQRSIPLEVAENAARSDYIVLEAIIFPGINFVWLGSILMIVGLALAMWRRLKEA